MSSLEGKGNPLRKCRPISAAGSPASLNRCSKHRRAYLNRDHGAAKINEGPFRPTSRRGTFVFSELLLRAKPSCLEIFHVVCSDIEFGPERHHSRQIDKRGIAQSLTISVDDR